MPGRTHSSPQALKARNIRLAVETRRRVAVVILLAVSGVALPAHAFRCGNELVLAGDREYDVLSKCGEPDFRESHAGAYLEGIGPIDVTETWYYNPGPTRFIRILTFRRGRLHSIETGGRGFSESAMPWACQPYELAVGMSKYELLSRCGKPVARSQWFTHGTSLFHDRSHSLGLILVEEWTYVFGSNRFRRFVRIVDGKVIAIKSGDKGE